jgi:nitrile hydratase subunit beta
VDGVHDLGGREGFGAVEVEPDEPVFHERWEGRVFGSLGAMLSAIGGGTPAFRHAIERMDPGHYLTSSYYEHWLTAGATLLVEGGAVTRDELDEAAGGFPLSRPPLVDEARAGPLALRGCDRPRFGVGARVVVRDEVFSGHTRCPAYVRGRRGEVVRVGPAAPIPEVEAHLRERPTEHTYVVRFAASELWPGGAEPGHSVAVDLYEHHLEPEGAA